MDIVFLIIPKDVIEYVIFKYYFRMKSRIKFVLKICNSEYDKILYNNNYIHIFKKNILTVTKNLIFLDIRIIFSILFKK